MYSYGRPYIAVEGYVYSCGEPCIAMEGRV